MASSGKYLSQILLCVLLDQHFNQCSAIFWQDLNSAWIIGSERRFSHDSFPELHWGRNPFLSSVYMLPPGFEPLRHVFGGDLVKVVQDIYALQHYRESSIVDLDDPTSLLHLDNHQASIESRLYSQFLTTDESSGALAGCILALYLCTYMLFSEVWAGHFIPSHMSANLLRILRDTKKSNLWETNRDAMLWCTIVGGTFAQLGVTRSEYILLLHQSGYGTLPSAWKETESFLEKFLWSKKLFYRPGKAFWDAYSLSWYFAALLRRFSSYWPKRVLMIKSFLFLFIKCCITLRKVSIVKLFMKIPNTTVNIELKLEHGYCITSNLLWIAVITDLKLDTFSTIKELPGPGVRPQHHDRNSVRSALTGFRSNVPPQPSGQECWPRPLLLGIMFCK